MPLNTESALLTDLYELTMAYGYWKTGSLDKEAVFHMTFRDNPFQGGFTVACGLETLLESLEQFHFTSSDLTYLSSLNDNTGQPLFEKGFLDYLSALKLECEVAAIPEGTVVFPHEPLIRVKGPLLEAQLLESLVLNSINYQTLVATKAARISIAAKSSPVIEFGLRRAQGPNGALGASRAAYIGGCSATSNVLAGKLLGIPVRGTMAHSWIMSFDTEVESFQAYAESMPGNCILLIDTYDSLQGVRNAIEIGKLLKANGGKLIGIRLDSGDLAYLSKEARKLLDENGLETTSILASNDLDETIIDSLKAQGAAVDIWGVGTKLVTAYDQPALNGVYKLSAIRDTGKEWQYKIKLSEQAVKISTPGILQVRRYTDDHGYAGDVIYQADDDLKYGSVLVDPFDMTRRKTFKADTPCEDLLNIVFRNGERTRQPVSIHAIRNKVQENLSGFHEGIKRFTYPHQYPVGLESNLFALKTELVLKARGRMNKE